jgi:cellulose synthase/poly-beta-1,6-N-acetylglucosamine synthase-like glycosyltransferase
MFVALLSFITSYFTPAIYFFILYVTIFQIDVNSAFVSYIAIVVSMAYVLVVLIAIAGSLTGKIWAEKAHYISYTLTCFTLIMYGLIIYNVFFIYIDISSNKLNLNDFNILTLIILSVLNVVCFILIIIIHIPTHCGFVCKLILDQISYMVYMGAYSQTMVIHGFCNVDDVSWGTKGASTHGVKKYTQDKVFFVSSW